MSLPTKALIAFRTFFLTQAAGFIHPALELIYTPHAGVTLRVKQNHIGSFPKGEVAISCPHGASLSALNAVAGAEVDGEGRRFWRNGIVCRNRAGVKSKGGDVGEVMKEEDSCGGVDGEGEFVVGDGHGGANGKEIRLELPPELGRHARPQFVAAVWIAVQYLLGDESPWARYFDVLPGLPVGERRVPANLSSSRDPTHLSSCHYQQNVQRGLEELDTPLWWEDEEHVCLRNTNLAKGIADLQEVWEQEWKRWESVVMAWGEEIGVNITW